MPKQIFVNLPVKDLERSKAFFSALGFRFNPQFTDEKAACLVIEEASGIYAMLLVEKFFAGFTSKPIADATKTTEMLIALSLEDRAAVDGMVARAVAAGGSAPRAARDMGFMYQHGFDDPDGHAWEVFFMDGPPPAA